MSTWGLFSGFIGGFVAWIVTTSLGQPLQRFIQLRQEAAFVIAQHDNRAWIDNPEANPPENDWLDKRREAYDKTGTALIAFADSNLFITRMLRLKCFGPYRCYIRLAGDNLRTLGAAYPGTQANEHCSAIFISSIQRASPCFQSGSAMPNRMLILFPARREFLGRTAGNGYSSLGIGLS